MLAKSAFCGHNHAVNRRKCIVEWHKDEHVRGADRLWPRAEERPHSHRVMWRQVCRLHQAEIERTLHLFDLVRENGASVACNAASPISKCGCFWYRKSMLTPNSAATRLVR